MPGDWKHLQDYWELQKRNRTCVCCSKIADTFDHILALSARSRTSARLHQLDTGGLQPMCRPCNRSKWDGTTCLIHKKYLGLWNYLPSLENIE